MIDPRRVGDICDTNYINEIKDTTKSMTVQTNHIANFFKNFTQNIFTENYLAKNGQNFLF